MAQARAYRVKAAHATIAFLMLVTVHCARAPQRELDAADAAFTQAAAAQAKVHAPAEWTKAEEARRALKVEFERQQRRPAFLRSFGRTTDLAREAAAAARVATETAAAVAAEIAAAERRTRDLLTTLRAHPLESKLWLCPFLSPRENWKAEDLVRLKGVETRTGKPGSRSGAVGLSYRVEMSDYWILPVPPVDRLETWMPPGMRALVLRVRKCNDDGERMSDQGKYILHLIVDGSRVVATQRVDTAGCKPKAPLGNKHTNYFAILRGLIA